MRVSRCRVANHKVWELQNIAVSPSWLEQASAFVFWNVLKQKHPWAKDVVLILFFFAPCPCYWWLVHCYHHQRSLKLIVLHLRPTFSDPAMTFLLRVDTWIPERWISSWQPHVERITNSSNVKIVLITDPDSIAKKCEANRKYWWARPFCIQSILHLISSKWHGTGSVPVLLIRAALAKRVDSKPVTQ